MLPHFRSRGPPGQNKDGHHRPGPHRPASPRPPPRRAPPRRSPKAAGAFCPQRLRFPDLTPTFFRSLCLRPKSQSSIPTQLRSTRLRLRLDLDSIPNLSSTFHEPPVSTWCRRRRIDFTFVLICFVLSTLFLTAETLGPRVSRPKAARDTPPGMMDVLHMVGPGRDTTVAGPAEGKSLRGRPPWEPARPRHRPTLRRRGPPHARGVDRFKSASAVPRAVSSARRRSSPQRPNTWPLATAAREASCAGPTSLIHCRPEVASCLRTMVTTTRWTPPHGSSIP
jgi:hypothetical protein